MTLDGQFASRLRWQSKILLILAVGVGTTGIALRCIALSSMGPALILPAFAIGGVLALLTWKTRAATGSAALTGGLFATALYLATPGWQTALWPLIAALLLTLAATRYGRARKQRPGVAEGFDGRTAAQVAANLGAAILASFPLDLGHDVGGLRQDLLRVAIAAALAEAAADTLSSEIGEVLGGEPRLLTTLQRVPIGTDGAVSAAGTTAGCIAAVIVAAIASIALDIAPRHAVLVALAAVIGLFTDSLLGAALESRGRLNNDAVNFLSTVVSAILAFVFSGF